MLQLAPGSVLFFSSRCPLPPLTGAKATISAVRSYQFDNDITVSYTLNVETKGELQLTIAEDEQGYYLGISRPLTSAEQDAFFGSDALGFFKEESSARSIRCKADPVIEAAWVAPRYSKTVDWIEGQVTHGRLSTFEPDRQAKKFRYNLLADEVGSKALEIEHYGANEDVVYLTVYRPAEDIEQISEPLPNIPLPAQPAALPVAAQPTTKASLNGHSATAPTPKQVTKPDFRRVEPSNDIHIVRAVPPSAPVGDALIPPLPSFLMSREKNYLSLDEILTPETERMRCDLESAKILIDTALERRAHVSDIMRDLLGLESRMADEAVFELPLSDKDYHALAQRYRLRPDRKAEIRACLQEELRIKLRSIAKN